MRSYLRSRRPIALFAAYVFALQAMLLPLTVAAGASFVASLCASVAAPDGPARPVSHDQRCPCAAGCGMQCCAQALLQPPRSEPSPGPTRFAAIAVAPAIEIVLAPPGRGRRLARAPPSA